MEFSVFRDEVLRSYVTASATSNAAERIAKGLRERSLITVLDAGKIYIHLARRMSEGRSRCMNRMRTCSEHRADNDVPCCRAEH
jgi:hypothetical protein